MLVDAFVREDFQRLLANTLPTTSRWDRRTLHLLIHTMLSHFERKYRHQQHVPQTVAPLVERAIHEELTALILTWLKQHGGKEASWRVELETVARVMSWSIFGTVIQWSQEETTISLEQMANDILLVVLDGVAQLVPDVLPE